MPTADFDQAIAALAGDTPPRVWSLIVTVFGDLAQSDGDQIAGPILGEMLALLGVRPEAMRVALHRLRNEGWIETEKRGREGLHRLTASGREQSAQAATRIYAQSGPAAAKWHILCFEPVVSAKEQGRANQLQSDGYVRIAPGVYLSNGAHSGDAGDAFLLQGSIGDIPDWLSQSLIPDGYISAFKDLSAALDLLMSEGPDLEAASALQIAALRTLIVHRWRKLVLRLPNVPDALFGPDWEGSKCRAKVMRALDAMPRPDVSALG